MAAIMRIAIIGGGATGVLAALHLARSLPKDLAEILIVEPATALGRGLAYATDDPRHLLNVRIANMSAFANQPDHLLQWLQRRASVPGVTHLKPGCFIPRGVYGAYVADLARELIASGMVRHIVARCVDLIETRDVVSIVLNSGYKFECDRAILATGHDGKPELSGIPAKQPWAEDTLADIGGNTPVLIVGSGLSMVDMVLSLDRRGHRGKVTALSHRGLLSAAHRSVKSFALAEKEVPFGAELSHLTSWLRGLARAVTIEGGDWRSVIDAVRPHTQGLWRSMSPAQKRRFLRHLRVYWDIHRHRMAPEAETQIAALRAAGRLDVVAGRFVRAEETNDGIIVEIARRGSSGIQTHTFARLIDCTGLADDPRRSQNPIIKALLARGAVRTDLLGIGLDIDDQYALVDATGRSSARVQALGPLARAAFWECIAIPDIRVQCQNLAENIASKARQNAVLVT
jgi:uncharacterized NAD(P)/FAD-binding protein YdhS